MKSNNQQQPALIAPVDFADNSKLREIDRQALERARRAEARHRGKLTRIPISQGYILTNRPERYDELLKQ